MYSGDVLYVDTWTTVPIATSGSNRDLKLVSRFSNLHLHSHAFRFIFSQDTLPYTEVDEMTSTLTLLNEPMH
jgi:hypothetical protein